MKKYVIIIISLILLSIIIPTVFYFKWFYTGLDDQIDSQKFSEFGTFQSFIIAFWSLIINIVLVILAYKAFQNFDVKKQFHNKQLDLVSLLATDISVTQLSNMMYETKTDPSGNDQLISTGFRLSFFEISLGFDYSKFEKIYILSKNIENSFPFLKHRKNPLLPKDIAKSLNKLYRPLQYHLAVDKKNLPKNYVVLYSENIDDSDFSKTFMYLMYKNPKDFREDVIELRNSIITWYKEYGAEDLNI